MGWLKKLWNKVIKPIATVAAIIYTGGLAAAAVGGGVLGAAITFGARVLAATTVSKMMTKASEDPGASASGSNVPPGNRFQAGPSLTNKLPVVYGNAYMPGILTDAVISTDQKYMWFVYAISEATDTGTFIFDDPNRIGYPLAYWNDKQMVFDATDRTKVIAFRDDSVSPPVDDTKVNGKVYCYYYSRGSANPMYGAPNAISVLSDSVTGGGIDTPYRWTSTDVMSNTAFMIVRIQYDQDANLTSIGSLTTYIQNSLNQPGSVAIDYLTNTRYGCGVPINLVDVGAFTGSNGLNQYSAEIIDFNDAGGVAAQARYKINGPLDTARNCMDNLNTIMDACDSWLKWDETYAKWSVIINRSYSQAGLNINNLFAVYADTISVDTGSNIPASNFAYTIGGISITPTDLNSTYNKFEVQFPSKLIKDQTDYAYINLPSNLINPNEPINNAILQLPLVNDSVQAQYIGTRRLATARDDLIVAFNTDYGGIQVEAGDIIRVYHEDYGWSANYPGFENGKLFRVTQVQETKDDQSNLIAYIVASEYNDTIYGDGNITAFNPAPNTGITDPLNISTPLAPFIMNTSSSGAVPSFDVVCTTPLFGSVTSMEFWYALSSSPPNDTSQFKLWSSQYYSSGPVFPALTTLNETVTGLPPAPSGFSYYWRVRAAGTRSKSDFSPNSGAQSWNPNPTATVTGQNFQATYQPNPVSVSLFSNGQANLASFTVRLYGLSGPGQVDYTNVTSNSSMANSSWRIDIPNINYSGITFNSDPFDAGTYAEWPVATSMTANVATISTPIIYKDSTGNTYTAPPAILSLSKLVQGQPGSRGIVTLAYVPVTYNPTYGNTDATDANLSASFFATTGFSPPIDNDGAVFINETLDLVSARVYDSLATPYKWKSAVLQVPGQTISNNSINTNQLRANSISANKIQASAITVGKIAADAVTTNTLVAGSVTTNKLAAGAVTANTIATNTITATNIAAGAITTTTLAAKAVTAGKIDANAITSDTIAAGAITAGKIGANAITAGTIAVGAVTAGTIDVGAVTAGTIAANAVDANALQAFSITGGKIAAGAITATSIAANTITFENLVIGAVTQSRSTISDPIIEPIPFFNWNNSPKTWPDNTRCMVPAGGVSIIPTTDPRSSANIQYVEGSRIEVSFSVKIFTQPNIIAPGVTADMYNLVEVWKSGASSIYDRGFNTIRHSYDVSTTQNSPATIHAYGSGGLVYYSNDGGSNWYQVNGSTAKTVTGAITAYNSSSNTVAVQVAGPLQASDTGTTPYADYKYQSFADPGLIDMVFDDTTRVGGQRYLGDFYAMEAMPRTGKGGGYVSGFNYQLGRIIVGGSGIILTRYIDTIGAPTNWNLESSGTLKTLYSVYANDADLNNNRSFTAIAVGQAGTLLKSSRVWSPQAATWQPRTIVLRTGETMLSDFYGVAGDDTYGINSKWVAVGEYGMIQVSTNNGETWNQVLSPTPDNLNAVRYCNGKWVIVGDNGIILVASDPTKDTGDPNGWTQINNGLTDQDLFSVDYSIVHNSINIGGQDGIYHSSAFGTINFSLVVVNAPSEILNLTRMTFYGSYPSVNQVSPVPPPQQRILNSQVFSATLVDTGYSAGQETTYYLIIGNMAGAQVLAGQVYLQVTEVKR